MATKPIIPTLSPAPQRGEPADVFVAKTNAFLPELSPWGQSFNALADWTNSRADDAQASAVAAANSETVALASANNLGEWSSLTGSLSMPASVTHNDAVWMLTQNINDVTAFEPSEASGVWQLINTPYVTTSTGTQTVAQALTERVAISSDNVDFPVPSQHATITDALQAISRVKFLLNKTANILLESGFVMSEQVVVDNGSDFSFAQITSVDPVVTIDRSALTVDANIYAFSARYPAFLAKNRGALPKFGCLFDMDSSGTAAGRSGIIALEGGSAQVAPGCGVRNSPGSGLFAVDASVAIANGSDFTGSLGTGIASWRGAYVQADGADVSGSYYGVSASQARLIFRDGIADDCTRHAIRGDEGAVVTAANASAQRAAVRAVYAWRGALVFAENVNGDDAGSSAFEAVNSGTIICRGGTARNAGVSALKASENGRIDAGRNFGDVDAFIGTNATAAAVDVTDGGIVTAPGADFSGSGIGVFGADAGRVELSGANFSGCGGNAASFNGAGTYELADADLSNAGGHALVAQNGAVVNAENANGVGATNNGCYALYGAHVAIRNANFRKAAGDSVNDIVVTGGALIFANGATGGLSKTANTTTSDGIIFR